MASAHKCCITGKLADGEGIKVISTLLRPNLKVEVRFFEKQGGAFIQDAIDPDCAERVESAIRAELKMPREVKPVTKA